MLSERELSAAIGSAAYGPDGEKIGTVEHFFTDDRTGAPTWVAISTGLFGTRHSVVPAADATFSEGTVRLPVTKEAVRTAPSVSDQHLDPEAEALLRRHYGLDGGTAAAPAGDDTTTRDLSQLPPDAVPTGPRQDTMSIDQAATSGQTVPVAAVPTPAAAGTDSAMTRSEEQLRVTTERYAAKRVRVVKYVVTEEVQVTVPIRREEIRIEEVPLDDDAPAAAGALGEVGSGGLPETIVLHTERPVVGTEVVPVERVRLRTEWVQEQVQVRDQVRRERIDVDEDRLGQARAGRHRLDQDRLDQDRQDQGHQDQGRLGQPRPGPDPDRLG
ncbi:PRC and DUF2382 domain-containing protein [Geodermatophilus sp. URMC 60]